MPDESENRLQVIPGDDEGERLITAMNEALQAFANHGLDPEQARLACCNILARLIALYSSTLPTALRNCQDESKRIANLINLNWDTIEGERREIAENAARAAAERGDGRLN